MSQIGSMVLLLNESDPFDRFLWIQVFEGQHRSDQQAGLRDRQRRSPFFSRF